MIDNSWYTDAAYDSRKMKNHPPLVPPGCKKNDRALRAFLLPSGVHCGEYRPLIEGTIHHSSGSVMGNDKLTHEQAEFDFVEVSKASAWLIFGLCGLIVLLGLTTAIVALIGGSPVKPVLALLSIGVPAFLFSKFLFKRLTITKQVFFKRRTGMVSHPGKNQNERATIPFVEFEGYFHSINAADGKKYKLYIIHRSTHLSINTGKKWSELSFVCMEWDFIQQYMNISMPLPDIPKLEPYRHLDPTTAAYDKQQNRLPHYWRDSHDRPARY